MSLNINHSFVFHLCSFPSLTHHWLRKSVKWSNLIRLFSLFVLYLTTIWFYHFSLHYILYTPNQNPLFDTIILQNKQIRARIRATIHKLIANCHNINCLNTNLNENFNLNETTNIRIRFSKFFHTLHFTIGHKTAWIDWNLFSCKL